MASRGHCSKPLPGRVRWEIPGHLPSPVAWRQYDGLTNSPLGSALIQLIPVDELSVQNSGAQIARLFLEGHPQRGPPTYRNSKIARIKGPSPAVRCNMPSFRKLGAGPHRTRSQGWWFVMDAVRPLGGGVCFAAAGPDQGWCIALWKSLAASCHEERFHSIWFCVGRVWRRSLFCSCRSGPELVHCTLRISCSFSS